MEPNAAGSSPGTRVNAWTNRLHTWQIALIALSPIAGMCACCFLLFSLPGSEFVGPPVQAPAGDFVAQIRESNSGALDSFHTNIFITDESVKPRLFSSGRETSVFYGTVHPCTVILKWESENHLVVTYPPGSRDVRERHPDWPDLSVTFVHEMPDDEQILEAFGVETVAECYSTYFREGTIRRLFDLLAGE